ncbi:hypothetical protein QTP88_019135 [Uroleucon formosanum]
MAVLIIKKLMIRYKIQLPIRRNVNYSVVYLLVVSFASVPYIFFETEAVSVKSAIAFLMQYCLLDVHGEKHQLCVTSVEVK